MFDDTCIVPEQAVLEVFVVIVELSIPSEKVTETAGLRPVEPESEGEDEETEGAVVYPEPPLDIVTTPTTLSDILVDAAAPTPPSSPVKVNFFDVN